MAVLKEASDRYTRQMAELAPAPGAQEGPVRLRAIEYQRVADGCQARMGDVRYQRRGGGMTYTVRLNEEFQVTAIEGGGW